MRFGMAVTALAGTTLPPIWYLATRNANVASNDGLPKPLTSLSKVHKTMVSASTNTKQMGGAIRTRLQNGLNRRGNLRNTQHGYQQPSDFDTQFESQCNPVASNVDIGILCGPNAHCEENHDSMLGGMCVQGGASSGDQTEQQDAFQVERRLLDEQQDFDFIDSTLPVAWCGDDPEYADWGCDCSNFDATQLFGQVSGCTYEYCGDCTGQVCSQATLSLDIQANTETYDYCYDYGEWGFCVKGDLDLTTDAIDYTCTFSFGGKDICCDYIEVEEYECGLRVCEGEEASIPFELCDLLNECPVDLDATLETLFPTVAPTTKAPTEVPTVGPTKSPTKSPTTDVPTAQPTTTSPTQAPTPTPTDPPTPSPITQAPTKAPTPIPATKSPTSSPTKTQSGSLELAASTDSPTDFPSAGPTDAPTATPTTAEPRLNPTTNSTATSSPSAAATSDEGVDFSGEGDDAFILQNNETGADFSGERDDDFILQNNETDSQNNDTDISDMPTSAPTGSSGWIKIPWTPGFNSVVDKGIVDFEDETSQFQGSTSEQVPITITSIEKPPPMENSTPGDSSALRRAHLSIATAVITMSVVYSVFL